MHKSASFGVFFYWILSHHNIVIFLGSYFAESHNSPDQRYIPRVRPVSQLLLNSPTLYFDNIVVGISGFAGKHFSPGEMCAQVVWWLLLDSLAQIIPLEMFSLVFYCIIGQFRCYFSAKREGVMPVNMRENTEKSNQEESPLWKELKNRQFLFLRFSSVYSFDITCLRVFFCSSFIKRSFGLLNIFEERAPSNEL